MLFLCIDSLFLEIFISDEITTVQGGLSTFVILRHEKSPLKYSIKYGIVVFCLPHQFIYTNGNFVGQVRFHPNF